VHNGRNNADASGDVLLLGNLVIIFLPLEITPLNPKICGENENRGSGSLPYN
jgi:hypothetical protein